MHSITTINTPRSRQATRALRRWAITLAAAVCAAPALAQDLTVTTPARTGPVLIRGATVHTMTGEVHSPGYIMIDARGVITAVGPVEGPMVAPTIIDATGLHAYPGMIDAVTTLGLREIFAVRASEDQREVGAITPEARAITAINPDSTLLPVARTNGILYAGVLPEGGVIQGQAAAIALDGWTSEDLAIEPHLALVISWPQMRPVDAWWMDQSEREQTDRIRDNLETLDNYFQAAVSYDTLRSAGTAPIDMRFEATRRYLPTAGDDQRPVFIRAQDVDQITASITWAARYGLRPVIVGGRDAPLVSHLLRKHEVPVILTGTHTFPKRADSPVDDAFTLPHRLEQAGILWCLGTDGEPSDVRNLPYQIGLSVAHGLPIDAATRGVTINAAKIFGLDDRIGSIEPGKLASIILTDGDPLLVTTNVARAFLAGREIDLSNKQTALNEKYREKYRQLGILNPDN